MLDALFINGLIKIDQISWIKETPCIEEQANHNKLHCTPNHTWECYAFFLSFYFFNNSIVTMTEGEFEP